MPFRLRLYKPQLISVTPECGPATVRGGRRCVAANSWNNNYWNTSIPVITRAYLQTVTRHD